MPKLPDPSDNGHNDATQDVSTHDTPPETEQPQYQLAICLTKGKGKRARSGEDIVDDRTISRVSIFLREKMGLASLLESETSSVIHLKTTDRVGETALAFKCDLLRAALLCDIIRNHDRQLNQSATWVYIKKGDNLWSRLPDAAVLTALIDDKAQLNPEWFRDEGQKPAVQGTYFKYKPRVF